MNNYHCGLLWLVLLLLLPFGSALYAQSRSLEQARAVAAGVLPQPRVRGERLTLLTEKRLANSEPAYYVFTTRPGRGEGFAIVSGREALPAIIGYSPDARFVCDSLPAGLQAYLRHWEQVASLPAGAFGRVRGVKHPNVAPIKPLLMELMWDQGAPYNGLLPELSGKKPYVGCVATALAQLCRYYCWPPQSVGEGGYYLDGGSTGDLIPYSLSSGDHKYDYSLLPPRYGATSSPAQQQEVAKLSRDLGMASKMSYGKEESSAYDLDALVGMVKNFLYHSDLRICLRAYYTDEEWEQLVVRELQAGRPVYYSGTAGQGGHAFVCDGYDGAGRYHFNWGWSGYGNGYYLLTDLTPNYQGIGAGADGGYVVAQGFMQGMQPGYMDPIPGLPLPMVADRLLLADGSPLLPEGQTPVVTKTKAALTNIKVSHLINYGATASNCQVAMRLAQLDGVEVKTFTPRTIKLSAGFFQKDEYSNFNVNMRGVPDGTYLLYPVAKSDGGAWETLRLHKHEAPAIKVTVKGDKCELAYYQQPVVKLAGQLTASTVHKGLFAKLETKFTNEGTAPYAANVGMALLENSTDTVNPDHVYFTSTYLLPGESITFTQVVTPSEWRSMPYVVPVWDASASFAYDKRWQGRPHDMLGAPVQVTVSSENVDSSLWPIAEFVESKLSATQDDVLQIKVRLKNQAPNTYYEGLFSLGYFDPQGPSGQFSYEASGNVFNTVEGSDFVEITFEQPANVLRLGISKVHVYVLKEKLDKTGSAWMRLNDASGESATMEIDVTAGKPPVAGPPLPIVQHPAERVQEWLKSVLEPRTKKVNPVEDPSQPHVLTLYPNPTGGQVVLALPSGRPIRRVEVYALTGQLLYSERGEARDYSLDLSALAPGAYLVRTQDCEEFFAAALLRVQR